MRLEAIFHQCGGVYAYPIEKDTLLIQLRAARSDLQRVEIIYGDRYTGPNATDRIAMFKYASDLYFDYFRAEVQLESSRYRYMFLLDDGRQQMWYNELGFSRQRPRGYHSGYFQFPYIPERDFYMIPDWVQDAVVYEIFPDRFYNGDLSNDPTEVRAWGELPENQWEFFGGDLAGIMTKLSYIKELGANTLYLTPIFAAETNHKYDTTDYYQIDPTFGDNKLFGQLVQEAHRLGIRVVLDAVFNHCGYQFPPFQDVIRNQDNSPYVEWFNIWDFPIETDPANYETFSKNVWNLPKLMTGNQEVRDYLLNVAEYWVREYDIDGWRLDVANEIDHTFWREMRRRLRAIKPDFYLVGEIWHHAGEFLRGEQFDGVMNYPFLTAASKFFGEKSISIGQFNAMLTENRVSYQRQAVQAAWNLLDSHDIDRALTRFHHDKAAYKLAVTFQMTYLGVPMIYYGDEIGLAGGHDPDCRRCMFWDEEEWDLELLNHYQQLISLRHQHRPLRRGDYQALLMDEARGLYVYKRYTDTEEIVIALNNGLQEEQIELSVEQLGLVRKEQYKDLLTGQFLDQHDGKIRFQLPASEAILIG